MKVVYIAGRYRAPTPWAVEQNIQAAQAVAAQVWQAGHVALCPHLNAPHMLGAHTDEQALAGTMELLRRCDAVLCVSNWRDSVGARAEVEEARRLGLPVFGVGSDLTRGGLTALTMDAAIEDLCEWADGESDGTEVMRVEGIGDVVLPTGMAEWFGAVPDKPTHFGRKHGTAERWDVCNCEECEAARPHPFVAGALDP